MLTGTETLLEIPTFVVGRCFPLSIHPSLDVVKMRQNFPFACGFQYDFIKIVRIPVCISMVKKAAVGCLKRVNKRFFIIIN
jgi:hypothetical protein